MPAAYIHLEGEPEGRARVAAEVALRLMLPVEALRTQLRARERLRDADDPIARADRMNMAVIMLAHGHEFLGTLRNSEGDIKQFIDLHGDPSIATKWNELVTKTPQDLARFLKLVRDQLGSHWDRVSPKAYLEDVIVAGRVPPMSFTRDDGKFLDSCYLWPADAFVSWLRQAAEVKDDDTTMYQLLDCALVYIGQLLSLGSLLVPKILDAAGWKRSIHTLGE